MEAITLYLTWSIRRERNALHFFGEIIYYFFYNFLEFLDQMNLDNKLSVFGSSFVYFLILGLCPYFHFLNDIYLLSQKKKKREALGCFSLFIIR